MNLKYTLLINGLSTLPFALILMLFASDIAKQFSLISPLNIQILSSALLLFSFLAMWCARSMHLTTVKLILLLDLLWVIASAIMIIFDPLDMTFVAKLGTLIIAAWVSLMSALEFKGIKQLQEITH